MEYILFACELHPLCSHLKKLNNEISEQHIRISQPMFIQCPNASYGKTGRQIIQQSINDYFS